MTSFAWLIPAGSLLATPGAWIAFAVGRREFSLGTRWALAIALSPFVLAAQVLALTAVGVSFAPAVRILAVANLASLGLALRAHRRDRCSGASASSVVVFAGCLAAVALPVATLWFGVPHFRSYGWHNMMHLATCYEIAELPELPEELDLAGVRLSYPWLGFVLPTAVAHVVDVSPTLIFPFLNLALMAALLALVRDAVLRVRPGDAAPGSLFAALFLVGADALAVVGTLTFGRNPFFGDLRFAPLVGKYAYLDVMPIGITLVAAIVATTVAALQAPTRRAAWMLPLLLVALGVCYPLLFPTGALIAGAFALLLFLPARALRLPSRGAAERVAMLASLAGAVAIAFTFLVWLTGGRGGEFELLDLKRLLSSRAGLPISVGPCLLLAAPAALRGVRECRPPELLLGAVALTTIAVFALMHSTWGWEYKFVFAAYLCLAPLVAVPILSALRRTGLAVGAVSLVLLAALATAYTWRVYPPRYVLARAVPLDENHFEIAAGRGTAQREWLEALRTGTTVDAIIVVDGSVLPLSVLSQRASYIATDKRRAARVGYSETVEVLFNAKAYPLELYARRLDVLAAAFAGEGTPDFGEVTRELRALGRPVALVERNGASLYLSWLEARGVGRVLHRGEDAVVWLIGGEGRGAGR